jgi:predicted 2-oxoglutarate/Fe(II)-dependent dioxygenase YbiX
MAVDVTLTCHQPSLQDYQRHFHYKVIKDNRFKVIKDNHYKVINHISATRLSKTKPNHHDNDDNDENDDNQQWQH